ncbi:MAG: pyridoxamine 5'-phosphate oxidase family protein [Desulfobulbaceae bacterium]|nr:pyridoxamine 5'-phosphate oxidase family protein [Desulfobulbaceae bacterium]
MNPKELREKIRELLAGQRLAVLSTFSPGGPYASLVAFHHSPDLRCLFFATPRASRKYANLMHLQQAALLIDSRTNRSEDLQQAVAVTATGSAEEFSEEEKPAAAVFYLERHPYLQDFIAAPSTAFFAVLVENYIYVSCFQDVFELRLEKDERKRCI